MAATKSHTLSSMLGTIILRAFRGLAMSGSRVEKQVFRLDVSVHNAVVVAMFQSPHQLPHAQPNGLLLMGSSHALKRWL